jgi:oligosaccharide repeat unit polymerase
MLTAILATFGMLFLACFSKFLTGDWLHPSTLFCAFWGFACFTAIVIAPEVFISGSGPVWIVFNAALVVAGGVMGTAFGCSSFSRRLSKMPASTRNQADHDLVRKRLRRMAAISSMLGVAYVFLMLSSQGVGIAQLTSLRGLGQTALKMSIERYSNTAQDTGPLVQLLLSVVYFAPLSGGTLFVFRKRRIDAILALLTMAPSLASFVSQSTRSAVIYGATMWVAGFLTARVYCGMRSVRIGFRKTIRKIVPLVLSMVAMIALLRIGDALRGGLLPSRNAGSTQILTDRVKNPLCGHFGALSYWIDHTDLARVSPAWGKYTFAGVYNTLAPGSRAIGIFSENALIPTGETNIYTYFRCLIEDASLPGAIVVIFLFGFAGGFLYRKVLEQREGWNGLLAPCYAWMLFGITSLFNYNSMLLTFGVYGLWWLGPWRLRTGRAWAH